MCNIIIFCTIFFVRFPAEILEKFKDEAFLLKHSTKDLNKKLIGNHSNPFDLIILERFDKFLSKYNESKEKIQRIFAYNIQERLFELDIDDCKEKMLSKAQKAIMGCLNKLEEIFRKEIESLIEAYEGNSKKLTNIPENEEQLLQIRILIEQKQVFLDGINEKTGYLNKILDIFDKYFYEIPVILFFFFVVNKSFFF